MASPFLIARFVFMALLVYLSLLILAFAALNTHTYVSEGLMVPGSDVMLMFNSCSLFILVTIAFADLAYPQSGFANLKFEVTWTGIYSLVQVGTSIGFTVTSSVALDCSSSKSWLMCSSSALLLPTTWINCFIAIAYFLTLGACAAVHSHTDPDVWAKTVYTVDWFDNSQSSHPGRTVARQDSEKDSWSLYLENIEASGVRKQKYPLSDIEKAPWADTADIRRGVDHPFAHRRNESSVGRGSSPSNDSTLGNAGRSFLPKQLTLPTLPLNAETKSKESVSTAGSRFFERFRDSRRFSSRSTSPFPHSVHDDDEPIPLPRHSQWLSADGGRSSASSMVARAP